MEEDKKSAKPATPSNTGPEKEPQQKGTAPEASNLVLDTASAHPKTRPGRTDHIPAPERGPVAVAAHLHIEPPPAHGAASVPDVEVLPDSEAERRIRRMSRRSF